MSGSININQGKKRRNLISGDFIVILILVLAFALAGGVFTRLSPFTNKGTYETELFGTGSTTPVSYTHLDVYKRQVVYQY